MVKQAVQKINSQKEKKQNKVRKATDTFEDVALLKHTIEALIKDISIKFVGINCLFF